jgi:peptidyl-prolyl cis-trans isomerase D
MVKSPAMFNLIHKNKRIVQVFLFLIAITFATWGIESYTRFRSNPDAVATVEGTPITEREFSDALREQQQRMRQIFGPNVDPEVFDSSEARQALLDSMISQRVVAANAMQSRLTVTDETLRDTIVSIPAFQADGRFSREAYESVLRAQNPPLTPAQFEARLRYDLALAQLTQAVADSAITPRSVLERLAALETEVREVSHARVPAQEFAGRVEVDEAQAKAYYDANVAEFRAPERVRAEYVVLSAEALARRNPVTEKEVKAAYEARAAAYRVEEQRRASHILVKSREEAEKLAAEVKKSPERFAELAKQHSEDPGSAEKGGDLGFFGPGMMVKPFEEAVFGMKEGEISGPVESEFGFHIIRLTGIQPAKARPLDEVRKEIEEELTRQRAGHKFAEAAETFSNMVYEQPDSLAPVAERFDLEVQRTDWVPRGGSEELGALNHARLLSALFSSDAIANRRNTDAIEIAPSTLAAARVVEHQPAAQRSFEEVKDEIVERLRRREAAELARKEGEAKLEKLLKGEQVDVTWEPARNVSRRDPQGLPPDVLRAVASADVSQLPAYVGMQIEDAGYLILRITKVSEGDPKERSPEELARLERQLAGAQYGAYVASLRGRADVQINPARLEGR